MKPTSTPQSILQQIAAIERMEAGKLCQLRRKGSSGPFYNRIRHLKPVIDRISDLNGWPGFRLISGAEPA